MKEDDLEKDQKDKSFEKKISSIIAEKILDYRSKLDFIPPKIVNITKTEEDRKEVNSYFDQLSNSSNQILDSKFYSLIIKMNRERDKSFLKEGTTRKERIFILSKLMLRVTTPLLYLSHERHISLSNFYLLDENKKKKLEQSKEKDNFKNENEFEEVFVPEFNQNSIEELKIKVLKKIEQKYWFTLIDLNKLLNNWEADIFSQMTRDGELLLIKDEDNQKYKAVLTDNASLRKNKTTISILIEPQM